MGAFLVLSLGLLVSCSSTAVKPEFQKLNQDYKAHYGIDMKIPILIEFRSLNIYSGRVYCRDFRDGKRVLILNDRYQYKRIEEVQWARACILTSFSNRYQTILL